MSADVVPGVAVVDNHAQGGVRGGGSGCHELCFVVVFSWLPRSLHRCCSFFVAAGAGDSLMVSWFLLVRVPCLMTARTAGRL